MTKTKEPKTICLFDSWNKSFDLGEANCLFTPHFELDPDYEEVMKDIYGDEWKFDKSKGNPNYDDQCNEFWDAVKEFDNKASDYVCPHDIEGDLIGYLIVGELGLWTGRHDIYPVFVYSLEEALHKCWGSCDDFRVDITDGVITCYAFHHDGTNEFTIYGVNKKSLSETQLEELMDGNTYPIGEDLYEKLFGNGKKRHIRRIDFFKKLDMNIKGVEPPKCVCRL